MRVLLAITISASVEIEEEVGRALVRAQTPRMISQAYTIKDDGTPGTEQEREDMVYIAELNIFKWLYEQAQKTTENLGHIQSDAEPAPNSSGGDA